MPAFDQCGFADFDFSDGGLLTRANITAPASAPQATSRAVRYEYTGGAIHDPEAVNRLVNQADGTDFVKYAYDDSGYVTLCEQASGAYAFLYDGDDQQRRAIAPDGDQELYYYDESGQRILAVTRAAGGAVTKARFWMGALEVEYSGLGTPTKTLAHLSLGTPVARVENRTTLEYQFHGGIGHLLGAMPEVGPGLALSVAYQYGPFGEILAQAGSTTDHTRLFNGKERDALSGLNYYGYVLDTGTRLRDPNSEQLRIRVGSRTWRPALPWRGRSQSGRGLRSFVPSAAARCWSHCWRGLSPRRWSNVKRSSRPSLSRGLADRHLYLLAYLPRRSAV